MSNSTFVLAIDNGTTSTRAIVFDHEGHKKGTGQLETTQIFPKSGWVEHDPLEIWANTVKVIELALEQAKATSNQIAAIGITNQRETTVLWDKVTGIPVYNAIVWQDTRTQGIIDDVAAKGLSKPNLNRFKKKTGLPLAT